MQTFWTVQAAFCYEKVIEKSKFIVHVQHITSEEEGRAFVAQVAKQHPFATHNCYAMIADKAGLLQRFSDDGEPQGTAGLPMLEVLKNKNMREVIVVVTRYFGGIKLGAGGLVRAYSSAVAEALSQEKLCQCVHSQIVQIQCSYDNFTLLKTCLQRFTCTILQIEYQNEIILTVAMPLLDSAANLKQLNNLLLGKLNYKFKKTDYIVYSQKKEK